MRWGDASEPGPEKAKTTLMPQTVVTDPEKLRWGTVSTIKAPPLQVARFIAWHLDAGAAKIDIFLDVPDFALTERLTHSQVRFHQCTGAYWKGKPEKARASHQMRQVHNATRAYAHTDLDFLAHVDVDEFILSDRPLAQHLAEVPADCAFARLRPVEMMAGGDPFNDTAHFKRTRSAAGRRKSDLARIYPTFGAYIPQGFISYSGGKNILRTGFDGVRCGIHAMLHQGAKVTNGHPIEDAHIGHAHAPTWDLFQAHFDFRMTHGSYRKKSNGNMILNDVLEVLIEDEGTEGLRRFYDEMCTATPARLDLLRAHDMLVTTRLDLDARVARYFGSDPSLMETQI